MSQLPTTEEETVVVEEDVHDLKFSNGGCCFWMPCRSAVRSIWWERISTDDTNSAASTNTSHYVPWWTRGWKKVREWSELVAGPKWKTFIRRFNKNKTGNGGMKFHYDPLSYSLNFDEGPGQNGHFDEDFMDRNFSSRYASLPVSTKSSMDFGKDGPFLI
ncbi:PREDICTED: uncharacterized protein LOC108661758 [Theobroma cacao]|uniref:Uncharacterized protein LOC108661758 n=1 Tax=Theobroma cacao TaxID=3641 RepID=A0AB32WBQ9_THECC|nr:PREDICTED: uncharacterized protein LOC108661758 [Theobroma cacao]